MKIFTSMVLFSLLPIFFGMMMMGVLVFELIDFFSNMGRYLSNSATPLQIGYLMGLYMPQCISFSIPLGLLFGIAFVLSGYYVNNEMVVIFNAGISLIRFNRAIYILGIVISIGSFFFDNFIVVTTLREKNRISDILFGSSESSFNFPLVIAEKGRILYKADYYDHDTLTLRRPIIIEKDTNGDFVRRVDAIRGTWDEERRFWVLSGCQIYSYNQEGLLEMNQEDIIEAEIYKEIPQSFARITENIDEMTLIEARSYIRYLRNADIPYVEAAVNYHQRFSFALTPMIVVLITSSMAGMFKKNTLLMNILSSVAIAVVFYVIRLVTGLLAINGFLSPFVGGWTAVIIFIAIAIYLTLKAPS